MKRGCKSTPFSDGNERLRGDLGPTAEDFNNYVPFVLSKRLLQGTSRRVTTIMLTLEMSCIQFASLPFSTERCWPWLWALLWWDVWIWIFYNSCKLLRKIYVCDRTFFLEENEGRWRPDTIQQLVKGIWVYQSIAYC